MVMSNTDPNYIFSLGIFFAFGVLSCLSPSRAWWRTSLEGWGKEAYLFLKAFTVREVSDMNKVLIA